MSDLWQEAGDYVDLQMEGGDVGWRGATFCARNVAAHARKGSFPSGYTAAGCLSPQCTGEAQRRTPLLPVSQLLSYHRQIYGFYLLPPGVPEHSTESFDHGGDPSVLKTGTQFMCLWKDWFTVISHSVTSQRVKLNLKICKE